MKYPWLLGFAVLATLLLSACDTEETVQVLAEERSMLQETVSNLEAEIESLEAENSELRETLANIGELSAEFAEEGSSEAMTASPEVMEDAVAEGDAEEAITIGTDIVEASGEEEVSSASAEIDTLMDAISNLQSRIDNIAAGQDAP
jgi:prefoldin subunit 5